jgi:hypothetical protein
VAEQQTICLRTEELAPDLALGLLTGPQRAEALAHVASCAACKVEVDRLAALADQLVLLAPEEEPPPGFESVVIAGITPGAAASRPRRRWIAAAVAASVAIIAAAGVLVGTSLQPADAEEADMITPKGREVGEVQLYESEPTWLLVSVPRWQRWDEEVGHALSYELLVELVDGRRIQIAGVELERDGAWGTTTPLDPSLISSVSIVDETGRVWCTGHFS